MLMNFVKRKGEGGPALQKLGRRTGHRVARLNDSLFVAGGVDREGDWVHEVLRINTQNGGLDSLLLDTALTLEGFSLFSLQENLYLWGGQSISKGNSSLPSYSDQLLHFDGSRFTPLRQSGQRPSPRADHLSASFGAKYFIIFAGHNHQQFFNDWYLLNIKTQEWRKLLPSLTLPPCSGGSMAWLSGRGILLLNDFFDQQRQLYLCNQLFYFRVTDFDRGRLHIAPLSLPGLDIPRNLTVTHISVLGSASFLVWGGHVQDNIGKAHGLSWLVDLDTEEAERVNLNFGCCLGVQAIFYKDHLHLLGGGEPQDPRLQTSGYRVVPLNVGGLQFKRHVCEMCKLYYDEEWRQSTREIYQRKMVQNEVDYGYHSKMDNFTLRKFSSYIRQDLYAFILILTSLSSLNTQQIDVGLNSNKRRKLLQQLTTDSYHYFRLSCHLDHDLLPHLANEIILERRLPASNIDNIKTVSEAIMGIKLGAYRLGSSSLMVLSIGKSVCVVFFSCSQLDVPTNNFSVSSAYLYLIDSQGKCSCSTTRAIVFQNLRPIFEHPEDYESMLSINNNFTLISLCSESFKQDLQIQQNSQPETGQCSLFKHLEDDHRRSVPLMQLAFLPEAQPARVYIQGTRLSLLHLEELLQSDFNGKILQEAQYSVGKADREIFKRIRLFHYPEQYWFKRLLVYHRGRLISHFREPGMRVCGLVEIEDHVQVDLTGNSLAFQKDRLAVERLIGGVRGIKRPCQH